jgi:voltage-gated sodium channel
MSKSAKGPITNLFLNDKFILLLIIVNSLTIFIDGFSELDVRTITTIILIDELITLAFVFEAFIKMRYYGIRAYFKSGWNKLDFFLVFISLPSLMLIFLHTEFQGVSYILILRVLRVFKFLRFFKFIPDIEQLIKGIQRALKTSVFVLFGFFIFNFMIAVLSCSMFKELSPEYFGNPVKSMYSIFRIFTVEGWYEIPDQIARQSNMINSFFIKGYFIFILIAGGILGLSLVNSIFVDSMVMDNNDDLEKKVDALNEKIEILIKKSSEK